MGAGASTSTSTSTLYENQPIVNDLEYQNVEKQCKAGYYLDNQEKYRIDVERCIKNTRLDILELLIPAGKCKDIYPVHIACSMAKLESLELLLSAGFPVAHADKNMKTPLHHCCDTINSNAALCATALILSSKKVIRMRDLHGNTALHCAVINRNPYVVEAICEEAYLDSSVERAKALAKSHYFDVPAVVDIRDSSGNTPQMIAEKLGYLDIVALFKKKHTEFTTSEKKRIKSEEISKERIMQVWDQFFTNAMNRLGEELAQENEIGGFMYGSDGENEDALSEEAQYHAYIRKSMQEDEKKLKNGGHRKNKHGVVQSQSEKSVPTSFTDYSYKYGSDIGDKLHSQNKGYSTSTLSGVNPSRSKSLHPFRYSNPVMSSDGKARPGIEALSEWLNHWLLCYSSYEQRYYVVDTRDKEQFASFWIEDFLETQRASPLHRLYGSEVKDDSSLSGSHMTRGTKSEDDSTEDYSDLPCSYVDAYLNYWMTFYDLDYNACYWMHLATGQCEYYLPIGDLPSTSGESNRSDTNSYYDADLGKYVKISTIIAPNDQSSNSNGWVAACQSHITYAWVIVISVADAISAQGEDVNEQSKVESKPVDAKQSHWDVWDTELTSQLPECKDGGCDSDPGIPPVYKYLNSITNQIIYEPPQHWYDIVASYNNMTGDSSDWSECEVWYYCCNEDWAMVDGVEVRQFSHYYWWNQGTGETEWA